MNMANSIENFELLNELSKLRQENKVLKEKLNDAEDIIKYSKYNLDNRYLKYFDIWHNEFRICDMREFHI